MISLLRVAGVLWLLASPAASRAVEEPSLEYRVKAAFLLNFTKFIEWPTYAFANDAAPISICIVGEDPFGRVLDEVVNGETVNSRRLIVRRIRQTPIEGACHVLFFDRMEKDTADLLANLKPGVLTVGQGDAFIRGGGVIAFVIENRRVRFDIDQSAAAKAELKMNAKLLNVARFVEK